MTFNQKAKGGNYAALCPPASCLTLKNKKKLRGIYLSPRLKATGLADSVFASKQKKKIYQLCLCDDDKNRYVPLVGHARPY